MDRGSDILYVMVLACIIVVLGIVMLLANSEFGVFLIIIGALWAAVTTVRRMGRGIRR
ncbi:MAG: hypothetical protein NDF56_04915 [archaeon GB-1845-036]|nr:hypothetical protein [Candidatus Culexmicrobium thermophilum]